jgi:hypothetical protein
VLGRTRVEKPFPEGTFQGTVISFDKWYKVRYDDGDEEELNERELRRFVIAPLPPPTVAPAQPEAPAAADEPTIDDDGAMSPAEVGEEGERQRMRVHAREAGGTPSREERLRRRQARADN